MKHFFLSLILLAASAAFGVAQTPGTTQFPTSLDSNTTLIAAANNCSTTLNGAINAAVTSITVASQTCFPSTGVFVVDAEYFIYTASTSTSFTVTRGAFGSTAASHSNGASVRFTVSAVFHNVLKDAIIAMQTKIGTGSSTPTANTVWRGTGTGTSGWGQIVNADVSNSAAIAISKLSISGTPDGTKFLRDDGSWQTAGGAGSGTVASSSTDQVPVYTGATTVTGSTDFTFTRSTSAKTLTVTSASSTALVRVTPSASGNSGFSATTNAHPGTGGGLFLPFVAGSQSDGPGIWWTNGSYSGLAGMWLSGGFNLQGWNSSNSALKLRKGTGTSSDGAVTFTFDPDSGYAQLSPFGTSAGETTAIRFLELAANGSNYFATKAADNIATTRTLVWPNDDPSAGEILSVTGFSGGVITTEWAAAAGGSPAGSSGQFQYNNGGSFGGTTGVTYASSGAPTVSVTGQSTTQLTGYFLGANTSSNALVAIQLGTGGSSGNFLEFRDSSGTALSVVDSIGAAGFGITSSLGARVHSVAGGSGNAGRFDGAALSTNTVLVARQGGSSTGNLFETQSSGGTAQFTIANGGSVTLNGNLASVANTPAQITSDQNNYAPGAGFFQRWSSDASRNVTGLSAGGNGEMKEIWNVGSNNIVLQNENASSTAANRFLTSTGADLTLSANKCAIARYDATSSRWRVYLAN